MYIKFKNDKLDFIDFKPEGINSTKEFSVYFEELLSEGKDEGFENEWPIIYGDYILFTLPKRKIANVFCMSYLFLFFSQFGVHLRLLGNCSSKAYGPPAATENIILINRFKQDEIKVR